MITFLFAGCNRFSMMRSISGVWRCVILQSPAGRLRFSMRGATEAVTMRQMDARMHGMVFKNHPAPLRKRTNPEYSPSQQANASGIASSSLAKVVHCFTSLRMFQCPSDGARPGSCWNVIGGIFFKVSDACDWHVDFRWSFVRFPFR